MPPPKPKTASEAYQTACSARNVKPKEIFLKFLQTCQDSNSVVLDFVQASLYDDDFVALFQAYQMISAPISIVNIPDNSLGLFYYFFRSNRRK